MIDIPEAPETVHFQRERGRLTAPGHRTDDDGMCPLLVIHETDGRWGDPRPGRTRGAAD